MKASPECLNIVLEKILGWQTEENPEKKSLNRNILSTDT